jgi:hypothetical protein
MFTNPSNNINDPRLNNLRGLFPQGVVDDKRSAVCSTALQSLADFKRTPESKKCNLFNESKDSDCQANFAAMNTSIKIAMKDPRLKQVEGMLRDISARILPTLEKDLKSFKAADHDPQRQATYDAAIELVSEIKIACQSEGQTNTPQPK